ncbi:MULTISPECIES: hypothetical protein [Lactobacillus]|jgi:hypothetical protein|uniref:hypothetical protein n=1 Tax=Lactobacillus TaxID=1578 RepID=UPI00061B1EEE|nr:MULTISPECIES: hypothetical protein [Lactobacillus]AWM73060.1 hypothetical protein DKL56_00300 [Lactobacillus apis]MBC6361243.1 hypothetical protein [Lactobacillus apis]MBI0022768.1 hypothetical protein [Lactobacillus sp. W8172]MCT6877440.1 hypothetical protein [Lactobacillus apis]RMC51775.1 hypothetical protein F5ESL0263_00390 [Lactobacillus sp. ESL0263]
MLTLLLIFALIWALAKLGVGIIKILLFILACGLIFIFFIHLLIPFAILGGILLLLFTAIGR